MTPEDKKIWTQALRSGKYRQGKYTLKRHDLYCCLGVACEAFEVEGHVDGTSEEDWLFGLEETASVLPLELQERLGIDAMGTLKQRFMTSAHTVTRANGFESLMDMNDCSLSFETIADVIDAQF